MGLSSSSQPWTSAQVQAIAWICGRLATVDNTASRSGMCYVLGAGCPPWPTLDIAQLVSFDRDSQSVEDLRRQVCWQPCLQTAPPTAESQVSAACLYVLPTGAGRTTSASECFGHKSPAPITRDRRAHGSLDCRQPFFALRERTPDEPCQQRDVRA